MSLNFSELLIVSNNPLVFSCHQEVARVEGSALDVLYAVLGLVTSKELRLNGHPVAGNLRLLRNPYRSIPLRRSNGGPRGEFDSITAELRYLEDAVKRLESLTADFDPNSAEDYQKLDMELLKASFVSELPTDDISRSCGFR